MNRTRRINGKFGMGPLFYIGNSDKNLIEPSRILTKSNNTSSRKGLKTSHLASKSMVVIPELEQKE